MKRLTVTFITLFIISHLVGCHQPEIGSVTIYNVDMHIGDLSPEGIWINSKYIDVLNKTKSPHMAQQIFGEEGASGIDWVIIGKDSLWHGFNLHEGNEYMRVNMMNDTDFYVYNNEEVYLKGMFRNNYREMVLEQEEVSSTSLVFYPFADFERALHSILLAGTYQAFDSMGNDLGIATFNVDGTYESRQETTGYLIYYDFAEPGMNVDQIEFGERHNAPRRYGWKPVADTLFLYHLECIEEMEDNDESYPCMTYRYGAVYRKLVKQP